MTKRKERALAYARAGIPVFPCRVNGKKPATPSGLLNATFDIPTIERWWAEADYNIGLVPEHADCAVVDLDIKDNGPANWQALVSAHGPITTRVVNTPSGGQHWYFYGSLPPSAGKLGKGIDTRGRGSYVLVPPSVIDGIEYTEANDNAEMAELPGWVPERMAAFKRPERTTATDELDLDHNVERARDYLKAYETRHGMDWGQEDPGDTFALASALKDLGLSAETVLDLLAEPIPHEMDWLEFTVANAFKYGQNEPGAYALSGTFYEHEAVKALEVEMQATATREQAERAGKWPVMRTWASIRTTPFAKPQWVWENRLLAFEPNLITGDAGVGKTTLAENLAVAVSAGLPLLQAPTRKMPVVLLVAEDTYGPVRDNLEAIHQAMQAPEFARERVHLLSVKSDRIDPSHRLASITDEGEVSDTPFMREYLAPKLAAIGECLFIMDPLMEFVRFNNLADEACRALATKFLAAVSRIGKAPGAELGPVTPMVLDHPSKASMASGAHYAGSIQMKAAFSFVSTLIAGDNLAGALRMQEMSYEILKGRYTGKDKVKFFRIGASPAYAMDGPAGYGQVEVMQRVYEFVIGRIDAGLPCHKDERGDFPISETAHALQLDPKQVHAAMSSCINLGWLSWVRMGPGGGRDRAPAHFERGTVQPF